MELCLAMSDTHPAATVAHSDELSVALTEHGELAALHGSGAVGEALRGPRAVNDDVLVLEVREGEWAYSEFPHLLLTVDYDAEHRVLALEGVGPIAHAMAGGVVRALD